MNYAAIKFCDIANGPGVRTSLFVSGCTHRCPDCFNAVAWPFDYGQPFTDETIRQVVDSCRPGHVAGLSVLGGEPMEPENQPGVLDMVRAFREGCPGKTVWCYSGYTFEQLIGECPARCRCAQTEELLSLMDVLVDGPFLREKKDITLRFRGSSNQRLLDLPASLRAGKPVWWRDDPLFEKH
ncbi:MAG: anaerobic ribonucleoside-triphosphate reductase activating protein [Clostridia bacterium]|nr:anaerobic ribonucleoside-triphosphate reductase activating protein [Clostridia bacterium]